MLVSRLLGAAFPALALVAVAGTPLAQEVSRSSWMPNVGQLDLDGGEQPLGDLWTFNCPRGGRVTASVDTKDDTDDGQADTDPVLLIVDARGNLLAFADDDVSCTYSPVCGFSCPSVRRVACGSGGRTSIIVRDFGASGCAGGGGYELKVQVRDAGGRRLSERAVDLGGGPQREVPRLAIRLGKAPVGPALDDEDVPQGVEFLEAGAVDGAIAGRVTREAMTRKR